MLQDPPFCYKYFNLSNLCTPIILPVDSTYLSYRVAYHLGIAGKPYSDGELMKRCFIDIVKCIHLGKEADYSSIALMYCNAKQAR